MGVTDLKAPGEIRHRGWQTVITPQLGMLSVYVIEWTYVHRGVPYGLVVEYRPLQNEFDSVEQAEVALIEHLNDMYAKGMLLAGE